jgi:hypothetical protein
LWRALEQRRLSLCADCRARMGLEAVVIQKIARAPFSTLLAYAVIGAAALYTLVFLDPYIAIVMLPFFLLASRRGKSPRTVWALAAVPALLLVIISAVKLTIAGVPLVTYDHLFLRENVLILSFNDWRIASGCVLAVVVTTLYFRAVLRGHGPKDLRVFTRHEKRGAAVLAVTAVGCFFSTYFWNQDIFDWNKELNSPSIRAFVKSANIPKPQLPTLAQVQTNVVGYEGLKPPAKFLPDVFVILQESTMHPNIMQVEYDPKHLYSSTSPHTGQLHVHTFAGGTWRSEFAMTTQMRPQEFGSDGLYVFHQLEGRINRSIFTMLKTLGYRTMVFYSVPGNFINAENFYRSIGVDEFYDPMDMGLSDTWDWKTPDSVYYKAMMEKVAGSKQPVVAMLLTISQHGPHNWEDPKNDYMTRFKRTDQDYGDFLDALKKTGRKAGVVAFGDHQPEFMTRFHDQSKWYVTNYDLRCVNFDCAGTAFGKRGDKPLDIVLLPGLAFEEFGFKLDDFSALQRVTFKACEGDITACDESTRLVFNGAFQQFLH